MELLRGDVVRSTAGHDKGKLLMVTDAANIRVAVADGRLRKLEKPKHKNRSHLRFVARPSLTEADVPEQDSRVRELLARYAE